ncbi:uncharacterized protein LOC106174965 [Lingula anatina]|uniref:Uncharacterized protein LOC106174965 n=1 Tax=Lingula anatina TaxID=7574 RepID=A0A1S3JPA8_LINAN|nr:uncharacterized protein LOC106174965 [Lingula anatina]|eukprot:XP_013412200.1 uncharacterized protein LOC106174965 [Lingula anatina]
MNPDSLQQLSAGVAALAKTTVQAHQEDGQWRNLMQERWRAEDARNARMERMKIEGEHQTKLDVLCRAIKPCDGSIPDDTRDWIDQIERTIPRTEEIEHATIKLALQTAQGSMAGEIDYFLNQQPEYFGTDWTVLRNHIRRVFLSADETSCIRAELERIKQSQFENTASYNRRFRDVARKAYPLPRSEEAERLLIKAYTRGLHEIRLARDMIRKGRPSTLQEAMRYVDNEEVGDLLFQTVYGDRNSNTQRRIEEPMEIGATQPVDQVPRWATELKESILSALKSAAQREPPMTSSNTRQHPRKPPQSSKDSKGWTADGQIKCFHCGKVGHVKAECYQLKALFKK